jgi:ribosomal protein S18 acetylase RimI-like enzyme
MSAAADLALVDALERHCAKAWPAPEIVRIHGWELRFARGSRSKRINALTPMVPVPGKFAETLDLARRLCADRGMGCNVRVTPRAGSEAEAELDRRGIAVLDATAVDVAPLGPALAEGPDVAITASPEGGWLAGMTVASRVPEAEKPVIARLLGDVLYPQAFATALQDGEPVAFARAAAGDGLLGIFHVVTMPEARRRGHALRAVTALMAWGRRQGAMRAYLQVQEANAAARALYARLGFREAYRYVYRPA